MFLSVDTSEILWLGEKSFRASQSVIPQILETSSEEPAQSIHKTSCQESQSETSFFFFCLFNPLSTKRRNQKSHTVPGYFLDHSARPVGLAKYVY